MLVDIHSHILPGIDDGAQDFDDTLALAEQAVSEGITHIIATPHYRKLNWLNKKDEVLELTEQVQSFLDDNNIDLKVYPSQEIHVTDHLIDELLDNKLLSLDPYDRYLLLEYPARKLPPKYLDTLSHVIDLGYTPVIAHVEKQAELFNDPSLLVELIEMGCLTQMTASSLLDPADGDKCLELLNQNLIHIIASDVHNLDSRNFHMAEAFELIEQHQSIDHVNYYINNSNQLINGEDIIIKEPKKIKTKKKRFFGLKWFN